MGKTDDLATDRGTGTGWHSHPRHSSSKNYRHTYSTYQQTIHRPHTTNPYVSYAPPLVADPYFYDAPPIAPSPPDPPPSFAQPSYSPHYSGIVVCDVCSTDLVNRPRIQCAECPNHDVCSTCYLTRRTPHAPHEAFHKQRTVLPAKPPRYRRNPSSSFNCDVCGADASAAPRARCLECINLDICGDCYIVEAYGPPGQGHVPTHKMNVIIDWQPESQRLVNEDYYPSNLYLDMIEAIFNFIHKNYNPPIGGGIGEASVNSPSSSSTSTSRSVPGSPQSYSNTRGRGSAGEGIMQQQVAAVPREQRVEFEVLEAAKLARFYRAMGMHDKDNSYLANTTTLAQVYSGLGLEYIIIPSSKLRGLLADRVFPWQIDHVVSTPSEPALTRAGFRRSFVLGTFLNPEGTFFILQNLLSTGMLVHPITGAPFRSSISRKSLPAEPLKDLVEWQRSIAIGEGY